MRLGVPREVKTDESRVAVTPSGVSGLVAHGHRVCVESGAGRGSRISDDAYRAAGECEARALLLVRRVEPGCLQFDRRRSVAAVFHAQRV